MLFSQGPGLRALGVCEYMKAIPVGDVNLWGGPSPHIGVFNIQWKPACSGRVRIMDSHSVVSRGFHWAHNIQFLCLFGHDCTQKVMVMEAAWIHTILPSKAGGGNEKKKARPGNPSPLQEKPKSKKSNIKK